MCARALGWSVCVCVSLKGGDVVGFWGLMEHPFSLGFQYHPTSVCILLYPMEFNV